MIIDDHKLGDKIDDLLDLAVRMRDAQKRFFRTRTRTDVVAAKNLEVEFDQKAKEMGYGENAE